MPKEKVQPTPEEEQKHNAKKHAIAHHIAKEVIRFLGERTDQRPQSENEMLLREQVKQLTEALREAQAALEDARKELSQC